MTSPSHAKEVENQIQNLRKYLGELVKKKQVLEKSIVDLETKIQEYIAAKSARQEQLKSKLFRKLTQLKEQMNELLQSAGEKIQRISALESNIKSLNTKSLLVETEQTLSIKKEVISRQLINEQTHISDLLEKIDQIKIENHTQQDVLYQKENQLMSALKEALYSKEHQLHDQTYSSKMDQLKRIHFKLSTKKNELMLENEKYSNESLMLKNHIQEDKIKLQAIKDKISDLTREKTDIAKKIQLLESTSASDNIKENELREEYDSLLYNFNSLNKELEFQEQEFLLLQCSTITDRYHEYLKNEEKSTGLVDEKHIVDQNLLNKFIQKELSRLESEEKYESLWLEDQIDCQKNSLDQSFEEVSNAFDTNKSFLEDSNEKISVCKLELKEINNKLGETEISKQEYINKLSKHKLGDHYLVLQDHDDEVVKIQKKLMEIKNKQASELIVFQEKINNLESEKKKHILQSGILKKKLDELENSLLKQQELKNPNDEIDLLKREKSVFSDQLNEETILVEQIKNSIIKIQEILENPDKIKHESEEFFEKKILEAEEDLDKKRILLDNVNKKRQECANELVLLRSKVSNLENIDQSDDLANQNHASCNKIDYLNQDFKENKINIDDHRSESKEKISNLIKNEELNNVDNKKLNNSMADTSLIQKAQKAIKNVEEKIHVADSTMSVIKNDSYSRKLSRPSVSKKIPDKDVDFICSSREAILNEGNKWGLVLMYSIIFFLIIAFIWSKLTVLDEITVAQGKVIPPSQIQVIQNLEGGILSKLLVKEGDVVKKGQVLLTLDNTRFLSSFKEGEQKYMALLAAISRLRAESRGENKIDFPMLVQEKGIDLIENEQGLFDKQKIQFDSNIETLKKSYQLAIDELNITKPLVKEGLMSELELLRLQRQINQLQGDIEKAKDEFRSNAQKELNSKEGEFFALTESLKALKDRLTRTIIRSPVNGTVNLVNISTVGAVIQPGMSILEVVPAEDNLLVEAKVKPQDIAFIRPGQNVLVKVTAYDYTIYGGLQGNVEHISADTIEKQVNNKEESYYKILVRTKKNYLGRMNNPLYIIPGMTVTVDIMTGKKSVLDYLLKPILMARETAMRER